MKTKFHTAAAVLFDLTVINADGTPGRRLKRHKNLTLNQGLNKLVDYSWCSLFDFFCLGTSSAPTSRDSGNVNFSIADGVATASAGFFEAQDVTRLLKLDSEAADEKGITITGFVSPTSVAVDTLATIPSAQGTVWYVSDVALGAEVQRFNLKSGDTGDHGFAFNGATGVLSTWITRVSNAVTLPSQTFKEIGWSQSGWIGDGVTGRALINGGIGDTLMQGQKYKVRVQLDISVTPLTVRDCPQITGWGGTAQEGIETIELRWWSLNGDIGYVSGSYHEPNAVPGLVLSEVSAPLRAPVFAGDSQAANLGGNPGPYGGIGFTAAPYVQNSFSRDYSALVDAGIYTSNKIRSISVGGFWDTHHAQRMLMSADQIKTSADKLVVNFRKSWGRILVN